MEKIIQIIEKYGHLLAQGTWVTLKISIVGTLIGLVIGLFIGGIRTMPRQHGWKRYLQQAVHGVLKLYIHVFRGTPMMVQALLIYYGIAQYFGVEIDKMFAAYLIVSINTGAYMSEVVRGGIIGIDQGQWEAAISSGMTHWQMMRYIIIPQTLRNILPATGNEFVINIKDTSVLNIIAVGEIFYAGKTIAGQTFDTFNTYIIIAVIYLFLTTIITGILRRIEKRFEGPKSFDLKMGNQMQV